MRSSNKFAQWCRALFRRERVEHELHAELEFDLAARAEVLRASGLNPEKARLAALREFGSLELAKDECRDERKTHLLEQTWQDIRFGLRTLRKNPGFTAVATLTLALGIGANTAIFSVVNTVVLQPLPFPDSNRLVMIWGTDQARGNVTDVTSYPNFTDWKTRSRSFDSMAAFAERTMTLHDSSGAELVRGIHASPGFFETLQVRPALGRTFRSGEEQTGAPHVAILTDAYWKERFGGRADVLGQSLRLVSAPSDPGDASFTIVGVLPPDFHVLSSRPEQIYVPLREDPNRGHGFLRVIGRLKRGASVTQVQSEMAVIAHQLETEYPRFQKGAGANVVPLVNALVGDVRPGLLIFMGVVAVVLLIACTNVAHLMLARGAARQRELAVRIALGAGRGRLIRHLLTESTLIALAGGIFGLLAANWTTPLLVAMLAKNFSIPRLAGTHTDIWVLLFTLCVSLLTGILFGIVPALISVSPDVNEDLRESSRSSTSSKSGRRARSILIVAETALALMLLGCAGLLLKALWVMRTTAPGFDSTNLVAAECFIPRNAFRTDVQRADFFTRLLARARSVADVRDAALVADLPLGGGSDGMGFHIVGRPDPAAGKPYQSNFNIVSAGYFRTMGIPVREGREFSSDDQLNTPGAIVINETAARRFWPGEDSIGRQILLDKYTLNVVGVVGDVRHASLAEPANPEIYLDYAQNAPSWSWLVMVVRTVSDPARSLPSIKSVASSVDSNVPTVQVRTMDDVLSGSIAQPRVFATLLGVFALLALALAAVGLYGVVSHSVAQRTHEIGVRMALGADRANVLALMLRHALGLVATGVVIGIAGAVASAQLLNKLVRSIHHADALTLAAVSIALMAVASLAAYLPARRAMRVDPVTALRCE
jgi:predicted permease